MYGAIANDRVGEAHIQFKKEWMRLRDSTGTAAEELEPGDVMSHGVAMTLSVPTVGKVRAIKA